MILTSSSQLLLVSKLLDLFFSCTARSDDEKLNASLIDFFFYLDPFGEANAEDFGVVSKEYVHVRVQ